MLTAVVSTLSVASRSSASPRNNFLVSSRPDFVIPTIYFHVSHGSLDPRYPLHLGARRPRRQVRPRRPSALMLVRLGLLFLQKRPRRRRDLAVPNCPTFSLPSLSSRSLIHAPILFPMQSSFPLVRSEPTARASILSRTSKAGARAITRTQSACPPLVLNFS